MPQENPMDLALREIQKLLDLIEINLYTTLNPAEIEIMNQNIILLEQKVLKFTEESNKIFEKCGLTHEQMRMIEAGEIPPDIGAEASESFMKAKQLRERLKDLEVTAGTSPELVPGNTKKNKSTSVSKRQHKKKYKRLGGDKDWKPL